MLCLRHEPLSPPVPMSLDHRIERVRAQLAELATYRGKGVRRESAGVRSGNRGSDCRAARRRIGALEAYAYAEFGEAGGLVNMTDEAPENADFDSIHHHLVQRVAS